MEELIKITEGDDGNVGTFLCHMILYVESEKKKTH